MIDLLKGDQCKLFEESKYQLFPDCKILENSKNRFIITLSISDLHLKTCQSGYLSEKKRNIGNVLMFSPLYMQL